MVRVKEKQWKIRTKTHYKFGEDRGLTQMKKTKKFSWSKVLADDFLKFIIPFGMLPPVTGNFNMLIKAMNENRISSETEGNPKDSNLMEQLMTDDF